LEDARAEDPLIERLHDPDPSVRLEASVALGRLRSSKAVADLVRLLHDSYVGVFDAGARALAVIDQSVPILVRGVGDESGKVRSAAWRGLRQLGSADLVAGLAAALIDALPVVRKHAALMVPFYADLKLETPLIALSQSDPDGAVREAAAQALAAVTFKREALARLDPLYRV
jgi:HEAT repeat protein